VSLPDFLASSLVKPKVQADPPPQSRIEIPEPIQSSQKRKRSSSQAGDHGHPFESPTAPTSAITRSLVASVGSGDHGRPFESPTAPTFAIARSLVASVGSRIQTSSSDRKSTPTAPAAQAAAAAPLPPATQEIPAFFYNALPNGSSGHEVPPLPSGKSRRNFFEERTR
jgi:hypothetical protein